MIKSQKTLVFLLYFKLLWLLLETVIVVVRVLEKNALIEYFSEVALGTALEFCIVLLFLNFVSLPLDLVRKIGLGGVKWVKLSDFHFFFSFFHLFYNLSVA